MVFRRIVRRFSGGEREGTSGETSGILDEGELERIGTEEDALEGYEEALERNLEAMQAEQQGDVDRAIALYEQSVAEEFVRSHPYERLADLYEQRRQHGEALRVIESFLGLARSGKMPRGAQRSADRALPALEAQAERYREITG